MNETLQTALAEILIGAAETAAQAKDFILAEMPDVVQQLLMWKFAQSLLIFAVGCVVFSAGFICAKMLGKISEFDRDSAANVRVFGTIFGGLLSTIPFGCGGLDWLQIWLAPKVYLIEYAADLVK